ncbi:MAG: hypothetical protein AAFY35_04995 [Pseudomonadota bacterium]
MSAENQISGPGHLDHTVEEVISGLQVASVRDVTDAIPCGRSIVMW